MTVLILGCGFSGLAIARAFADGVGSAGGESAEREVFGTRRGADGVAELAARGVPGFAWAGGDDPVPNALSRVLARTTHLISSVAPARQPPLHDPTLDAIRREWRAGALRKLEWIGYLSTIGVYGDRAGASVDEDSACTSAQPRSVARREAELAWQALGAEAGVPVSVLRLSGIYGPGRNAVRDALDGRGRILIKGGQVFNRIHVDDLATATVLAATRAHDGVLNVSDDAPAAPQDVVRYAHALVGRAPPPAIDFETAEISAMARSFYGENKRVDNALSKRVLGLQYRYPDYRAGLDALLAIERGDVR